jgi:hypothetical protein
VYSILVVHARRVVALLWLELHWLCLSKSSNFEGWQIIVIMAQHFELAFGAVAFTR